MCFFQWVDNKTRRENNKIDLLRQKRGVDPQIFMFFVCLLD